MDSIAETVRRFDDAFNRGDLAALGELITEDCVFENTAPPDGRRYIGRDAVLAAWAEVLTGTEGASFVIEDIFVAGDRACVPWRYSWAGGHVRGVDVMRVRDGRVSESFAYVKG
jgi:ketosteroid isomerase-like protein